MQRVNSGGIIVFPVFVSNLSFYNFHKYAMDAIRAKLDDLMGPDRDGVPRHREVTVGFVLFTSFSLGFQR